MRAGFGKRFLVFNASEFEEISDLKFGVSADSFADNISSGFEWNTCVYKTTEGEFLRFLIQSLVIINNFRSMVVLTSSVPAMPIMTKGLAAAKVDLQPCMN